MAYENRMQMGQKLAQVQVMSPQMQQSLAFLQAPMLDLQGMVNKELQENPVLEEVPIEDQKSPDLEGTGELFGAPDQNEAAEPPSDTKVDPTDESSAEPFDDFQAERERLAELSEEWRDHFNASQTAPVGAAQTAAAHVRAAAPEAHAARARAQRARHPFARAYHKRLAARGAAAASGGAASSGVATARPAAPRGQKHAKGWQSNAKRCQKGYPKDAKGANRVPKGCQGAKGAKGCQKKRRKVIWTC